MTSLNDRFETESVVESLHGSVLDEIISSSLKGKIKKRKGSLNNEKEGTKEEMEMVSGRMTNWERHLKRYDQNLIESLLLSQELLGCDVELSVV